MRRMIASNMLPRGVGERKLTLLFKIEADPRVWTFEKFSNVAGWGSLGIQELLKSVPDVLAWCSQWPTVAPAGVKTKAPLVTPEGVNTNTNTKSVVFTGGRDKVLEGIMETKGWVLSDTLTKKTDLLVTNGKESTKTKKASEYGIRIMTMTEFAESLKN